MRTSLIPIAILIVSTSDVLHYGCRCDTANHNPIVKIHVPHGLSLFPFLISHFFIVPLSQK